MPRRPQRRFLLDALPLVATAESLETMLALWRSEQITGKEMDSWLAAIPFQTHAKPKMITALLVGERPARTPRCLKSRFELLANAYFYFSRCVASAGRASTAARAAGRVRTGAPRVRRPTRVRRRGPRGRRRGEPAGAPAGHGLPRPGPRRDGHGPAGPEGAGERGRGHHPRHPSPLLRGECGGCSSELLSSSDVEACSLIHLARCPQSTSNPLEVRLAALTAWRRAPCEVQPSSAFLKLYTEQRLDVELRIAAYLAAMRCPSPTTIRVVKDALYAEDVNQGQESLLHLPIRSPGIASKSKRS